MSDIFKYIWHHSCYLVSILRCFIFIIGYLYWALDKFYNIGLEIEKAHLHIND